MSDSLENRIIADRYKVIQELGKGGMATVLKAFDLATGSIVAIKILDAKFKEKETGQERFEVEKEAFAKLRENPNVIKLFDVIQSGDEWYIILECIEGGTLKDKFLSFGTMTLNEIKYYFGALCIAIDDAHKLGIVHRDIKPDNVLLTKSGEVKLGDFGISIMEGVSKEENKVVGTPRYMAPEVITKKKPTPQSDIYSLGIMLYEFATGVPPFLASKTNDLTISQVKEKPTPPTMINPTVPQSLENIILKMIEKEPQNRYLSAREVYDELMQVRLTDNVKPYNYHLTTSFEVKGKEARHKIGSHLDRLPLITKTKYFITIIAFLLLGLVGFLAAILLS
ncbi:serine/threonine protein kinase [Spiroplasma helicoides]|uniref:Serine/threonine protein kinase n=1 Tax=Spiroplasma helicoides TaxID=216938 RepID=A0A1B3SLD2_9MOLU|nr:serine/threonine-protein kinase [Spiroplasma helicoides]AOG60727.1 serine/threonine protein kinase [Spiroplasma helicoides]